MVAERATDPALLHHLPEEYYDHDKLYMVTVQPEDSPWRTFLGELFDRHWDNYRSPCMYAGNSQVSPNGLLGLVVGLPDYLLEFLANIHILLFLNLGWAIWRT